MQPDDGTLATGASFTSRQMRQQGADDMHAVSRETSYAPDPPLDDMPEFAQFKRRMRRARDIAAPS